MHRLHRIHGNDWITIGRSMGIGSSSCSDHFRSIKKNHRSGEVVLLNKHRERGHFILAGVWQLWPFFRPFNISDYGIPFKKTQYFQE